MEQIGCAHLPQVANERAETGIADVKGLAVDDWKSEAGAQEQITRCPDVDLRVNTR